MLDIFSVTQLMKLLGAPICIYSKKGEMIQDLEDTEDRILIEAEDFEQIEWKYEKKKKAGKEAASELALPYIHLEEKGIVYCVMQTEEEEKLLGIGKLRIYSFADEETRPYPYCEKERFTAILLLLWKLLSGQELSGRQLWAENVELGFSVREQMTKEIFERQEEGHYHNPYAQELRERDSIRRGDVDALRRSIDEVYSGAVGTLANDTVRQYKNIAICVISLASRSAIEGGVNPERAFTMSDIFIRNIEENLSDPIKIEQAAREAEFEFARTVHDLREQQNDNPLVEQVRDYIFCHIHEPIRVRDVAEQIGMTPNYLSEQFSESMGVPLKQYIIEEKIISSEQLLKYTDYSIQEISSFCAFSSQSRFSVYFQRKNGITPARYRKRFRQAEMNKG
jgi:AraC-like DNA-binding protein